MYGKQKFAALLAGVSFWLASVAGAAPAWSLPADGLQLDNSAKQAYVAAEMEKIKHPAGKKAGYIAPDGWQHEKFLLKGVKTEKLVNPAGNRETVLLQLHGVGYVLGQSDNHRKLTEKYGVLAEAGEMYMVDYRLAPKDTYPAALDDAVVVYQELLAQGKSADKIIVAGDSAGGNLALALSLYLKEHKLPQPAMLLLISPWTTVENNLPSRKTNAERDLILGKNNPFMFNAVAKPVYSKGYKAKDPRLSPIYADLSELPPMLIQTGGYELFLDENLALAKKAAADGIDVTITIYPGMSHDFALLMPDLQDSVKSFAEIRDFVKRHIHK